MSLVENVSSLIDNHNNEIVIQTKLAILSHLINKLPNNPKLVNLIMILTKHDPIISQVLLSTHYNV